MNYEKVKIECPFCKKIGIDAIYIPESRHSVKSGEMQISRKSDEKYEIISDCKFCGKSKAEIGKALREGTPEDKEKRKKRYEEIMKLKEELNKERSST